MDGGRWRGVLAVVLPAVGGGTTIFGIMAFAPDYGPFLFCCVPLLMGLLTTLLAPLSSPNRFWPAFGYGSASLCLLGLAELLLGEEGVVCIAMAAPLILFFMAIGIGLGLRLRPTDGQPPSALMGWGGVILVLGGAAADRLTAHPATVEYSSYVDVDASPDRVWREVVSLGALPPTDDWILKTGVACPQKTELRGTGVGAERHCTLSTGPMPERVTAWQPGRRLGFVPLSTPPMLRETNPFAETHPPHERGYYRVLYGEFTLVPLPGGRTRLYRITRYEHGFRPALYWTALCNVVADHAHAYVLNDVKAKAEGKDRRLVRR